MRTCLNMSCNAKGWKDDAMNFCGECGEELSAVPTCECGDKLFLKMIVGDVKAGRKTFCEGCGKEWTNERIGHVLANILRGSLKILQEA